MTITLNGTTGITTPALDSVAPFSSADMPAGSVIQAGAVPNLISRGAALNSSSFSTFATVTITPKKSGSIIILQLSWQNFMYSAAGNYAVKMRIYNATSGAVLQNNTGNPSVGENDHDPYQNAALQQMKRGFGVRYDTLSTTSAQSYQIQFAKSADDRANTEFSHNSDFNSSLIWFEISQ